jgi:hypothetical protein
VESERGGIGARSVMTCDRGGVSLKWIVWGEADGPPFASPLPLRISTNH